MKAQFLQEGKRIDYTPSVAVAAGAVVVLGGAALVATSPIAADQLGALAADGVFLIEKDSSTFAIGDTAYWDADGDPVGGVVGSGAVSSTSSGNTLMGMVCAEAATGATHVTVRLSAAERTATIGGSITADDITGGDSTLNISGDAAASVTAAGGAVAIAGGAGGATSGNGGAVSLVGGDASNNDDDGGAVTIDGGAPDGTGAGGAVSIGVTNASSITAGKPLRLAPEANVAATGTDDTNAAALLEGRQVVTAADATKGVKLPSAVAGMEVWVINNEAAQALKVYPNTSDAIDGGTATTGSVTVAGGERAIFYALDATNWRSMIAVPA